MDNTREISVLLSEATALHQRHQEKQFSENRQRCIQALQAIENDIQLYCSCNTVAGHFFERLCELCSDTSDSLELVFDILECSVVLFEAKRIKEIPLTNSEQSVLVWFHEAGKSDLGANSHMHIVLPVVSEQIRMHSEISALRVALNTILENGCLQPLSES